MNEQIAVFADREIAFTPTGDIVEFCGVGSGPAIGWLADLVGLCHFYVQLKLLQGSGERMRNMRAQGLSPQSIRTRLEGQGRITV